MDKAYQIIGQLKDCSSEVLETVNSKEEAEYAMASYLLYDTAKYYTIEIVEVGKYASLKI